MPEEVLPSVERDEPLLRRFLPDPASSAIPAAAFRPTRNDLTGISVSIERYPNPIVRVLSDTNRPAACYGVCRFDLAGLTELSVASSPTALDPGHATIPEICPPYDELAKSDQRRKKIKDWQEALWRRSIVIHRAGDPIV